MNISSVGNSAPPPPKSAPPPPPVKDNDGDNDHGAPEAKAATPEGVGGNVDISA